MVSYIIIHDKRNLNPFYCNFKIALLIFILNYSKQINMYFVHFLTIYNVYFRVYEKSQSSISDIPCIINGKDNTFRNLYVQK